MLKVKNLCVKMHDTPLLYDVSFTLNKGDWLMVIGPNGAGKSTLIRTISGTSSYNGEIYYMGIPKNSLSPKQQARILGVVSQQHSMHYAFNVEEVVRFGRYCHSPKLFSPRNKHDSEKVENALKITGIWDIRHQSVLQISGGEMQRVLLAQVFAQEPSILLLDEPTNHLDIGYQAQLFPILQNWLKQGNRAILSVVHDLNLARFFGNKALLLSSGKVLAQGTKDAVFSSKNLQAAYGIPVKQWIQQLYQPWNNTTDE